VQPSIPKIIKVHRYFCFIKEPVKITDRGIYYQQNYNIAGGQSWSNSFSKAKKEIERLSESYFNSYLINDEDVVDYTSF
jgi:hypothetical protein